MKMHSKEPPPLSRAHAHTTVSPAGSQVLEGREPVERADLDARYRVAGEYPRGGEGAGEGEERNVTQSDSVCVAKPASGRTTAPINGRGTTGLKWEVGSGEGGGMGGGITTDEDAFKRTAPPIPRTRPHDSQPGRLTVS